MRYSTCRMNARGARPLRALFKAMASAAVAMQLAGCVPIPYRWTDDLPDVVPHLPEPFRGATGELLVLPLMRKQATGDFAQSAATWHLQPGLFLRPPELSVLQQRLASRRTGIAVLLFSFGAGGVGKLSETQSGLDELCLISPDGQAASLIPPTGNRDRKETRWDVRWKGAVSRTWRSYIIQLLADGDSDEGHPFFSDAEPACFSRQTTTFQRLHVDRTGKEQKQVIEFLNSLPVTDDAGLSH